MPSSTVISSAFPSIHLSEAILGDMGAPLRSGFDVDASTTDESHGSEKFIDKPFLMGLVGRRDPAVDVEVVQVA